MFVSSTGKERNNQQQKQYNKRAWSREAVKKDVGCLFSRGCENLEGKLSRSLIDGIHPAKANLIKHLQVRYATPTRDPCSTKA